MRKKSREHHESRIPKNKMKSDVNLWMEEMLKKHGWYIHADYEDPTFPYSVNIHTHGLASLNHLDLQICFPLRLDEAHVIITTMVHMIRNGKSFTPGIQYPDIMEKYKIEFGEAIEDGRVVLRAIFPDKYGNVRGEAKGQWRGCRFYFINN